MSFERFGISEKDLEKLLQSRTPKRKRIKVETEGKFAFGFLADTHLGSRYEKLGELHAFYNLCHSKGITLFFHAGDLIAGEHIYKGQENDLHSFGADNQVKYFCQNYPYFDDTKTYFSSGNHDYSYMKLAGVDACKLISQERKDMVYLGQFQGEMSVGDIKIRVLHGDGSGAYAVSYRGQKIAEQIPSGTKPHILGLGHWHTANYFFYRNMHIFNLGCFEDQTPYLMRKGLNPAVGGWIVNVHYSGDTITSLTPIFVPFIDKED